MSHVVFSADNYVSGKIVSLAANVDNPAIRIDGLVAPDKCDGGQYNWLYFQGTPEERYRMFSMAMAMSLTGKSVDVYTNSDGKTCRIAAIQAIRGF